MGFFAGANLLRLALKFWYVPVIAAMAFGLWIQHKDVKFERQRAASAVAALEQAQAVNERNKDVIRRIDADRDAERKLTEAAMADANARLSELNAIKKELRNAPGANDRVAPYFDVLGDKLRSLNPKVGH